MKKRNVPVAWWKCAKNDATLSQQLYDLLQQLEQNQMDRMQRNIRCARLYGNMDYLSLGPYAYTQPATISSSPDNRVKMNIISSMVDTVGAKISKMKPRTTFLTANGNWSVQERAKNLTTFIGGAFYQNDLYTKHQAMFKDGSIFDIGAVKHYRRGGQIISERVLPTELYVDFADAVYGCPSHMYHVKYVHKEILAEEYPKHATAIMQSAGVLSDEQRFNSDSTSDYVVVIEGWKLRPVPGDDDSMGRHIIAVEKAVLVDEDYSRDYFPFTFSRWSTSVVGFYGQSLADRLTGNQIEINKLLRIIQRSFHLGSAFKVFLEYGSKIAKEHINNEIGAIVYYQGAAPTYYVPQTVHPEFFRHLDWLIRNSYDEAGVSQLSAMSKMPAGVDGGSGKAIREYNDLETERFILVAQQYEQTFLEAARQYIDLACEMAEEGIDYEVVAESKRFVKKIKWSEVKLDNNAMVMKMFPTSQLPTTPTGKLAYVQELITAGFIDQAIGLSLMEFPDTEGYLSLRTAPIDDIMYTLDRLLYGAGYISPEPFQDLDMGVEIMQMAYLRAKMDGAPDSRLDNVRRWIAAADKMRKKAKIAQMPAVPMMPGPQAGVVPTAMPQATQAMPPELGGAAPMVA